MQKKLLLFEFQKKIQASFCTHAVFVVAVVVVVVVIVLHMHKQKTASSCTNLTFTTPPLYPKSAAVLGLQYKKSLLFLL